MKKLMAGCLAVVLLGAVAVGLAGYFGYRAIRPVFDGATELAGQARAMADLAAKVENTSSFTPPESGELTPRQLTRFLSVHDRVRRSLGPRWADVQARAGGIEQQAREGGRDLSVGEIGRVLSELGTLLVDARRAHVDALNAEGFSASEYRWVRLRAYEAAGFELVRGIDWRAAEAALKDGASQVGMPVPEVPVPAISEANRALVTPHLAALKDWLPLAMLGL